MSKQEIKIRAIGDVVRMNNSPVNVGRQGMIAQIVEVLPNSSGDPYAQEYIVEFLQKPCSHEDPLTGIKFNFRTTLTKDRVNENQIQSASTE